MVRARQDVGPFHAVAGVSARMGSIDCAAPAGVTTLNGYRDGRGLRAYPRKPTACVSGRGGSIAPGHAASVNRARGLQAGYPRGHAHRRKQGIRAGYRFLEKREASESHEHQAFGVSGPGVFHSSVWRSAEHVDKWSAQSSAAAFCAMGSAPGTTPSYAAIGL